MKITQQKRAPLWINEAGVAVPYENLKAVDKVNEKVTANIATKAIKANKAICELKAYIKAQVELAIKAFHADYKGKRTAFAGNYTIHNYRHDIKVEVSVNVPVKFDDLLIAQAQAILDDFLKDGISAKIAAVKEMIMSAFKTTRGKMDVKKILGLLRYKKQINDPRYSKAMDLIEQAQRRPDSKIYYRVAVKNDANKWEYILLSLADV